jgi:T5SS/PEP-CTERM-associated repeat protein
VNGGGLTVTNDFYLNEGGSGAASTSVRSGGNVTVPAMVVGYSNLGPPANFLITGAGSRLDATASVVVGRAGYGTLTLADGGSSPLAMEHGRSRRTATLYRCNVDTITHALQEKARPKT